MERFEDCCSENNFDMSYVPRRKRSDHVDERNKEPLCKILTCDELEEPIGALVLVWSPEFLLNLSAILGASLIENQRRYARDTQLQLASACCCNAELVQEVAARSFGLAVERGVHPLLLPSCDERA